MKISEQEVQQCLARRNWLVATIQQIKKDLSWQNLELPLSISPSSEELQEQLSKLFSYLEQGQHQTMINILYRVDVGEEQIQRAMSETVDEPFSDVVAKLLMKRCLLKVVMKHHFSNQENRDSGGLLNQ
tara:strand:+ start:312 stop:698 length:387 start_codon:yes stop_codon:yes gene_type:complete